MREIITIQIGQAGNSIGEKVRLIFDTDEEKKENPSFGNSHAMNMVLILTGSITDKVIYNSNESMSILMKFDKENIVLDRY